MSLTRFPSGITRFKVVNEPAEHIDQQPVLSEAVVLFVTCGADRYAYTWTRDGWDVQLVCALHHFASAPYPEADRAFCRRCCFCEWERWLTSAECDRSLERFDALTAGSGSPVGLGPQGH